MKCWPQYEKCFRGYSVAVKQNSWWTEPNFLKTAVQQYSKSYKFCLNSSLSAKESNYDLLFNSKSTSNYATYSSLPSMTCLTACLWMRTSYSGTHYFFSYSTSSYYDALTLGYDSEEAEINFNINDPSWRWAFVYRWDLGDILTREPLVCKSMYPSRPCRNRVREEKKTISKLNKTS